MSKQKHMEGRKYKDERGAKQTGSGTERSRINFETTCQKIQSR